MRHLLVCLFATISAFIADASFAQENSPVVVPERLQELALQHPVADRMGIKWDAAEQADVGRYMGMLSATNEVAKEIAVQSDRKDPNDADYLAALTAMCFLTNKPPLVQPYWPIQQTAFYSSSVRDALHKAVRPTAVKLAQAIQNEGQNALATATETWPKTSEEYFSEVLDVTVLPGVQ